MGVGSAVQARQEDLLQQSRAGGLRRILPKTRSSLVLSIILAVAVLAIYYPVNHYPFLVNIDDNGYVFENVHVLHGLRWVEIKWAFTHDYFLNYDPITFLAHSLNVTLFQLNGGRHHDVNLALHAINALLLFWLLKRSTGSMWRSFMVAALFAVHPVNVENVAWVSELKTLLSTTFFFLAIGAYLSYVRRPQLLRMLLVTMLFGFGLLAKPQIITLPFVLLLWDYWPLRRSSRELQSTWLTRFVPRRLQHSTVILAVLEKSPMYVVAAVDALLTLHAERKPWIEHYTLLIRCGSAIRSYAIYLGMTLWPTGLALNYPHPGYSLRWAEVGAAALLLVTISVLVFRFRRYPYLVVGWLWFVITSIPTINLVQIDVAALADRYAYIPFIGLFVAICWGVADLASSFSIRAAWIAALSGTVLTALSLVAHHQVGYWSDSVTVWKHTLSVTQHNAREEWELGVILRQEGQLHEALPYFYAALNDKPESRQYMVEVATTEQQIGNFNQAILYYNKILQVSKDRSLNAQIYANMGHAYGHMGDQQRALECYREAQRLGIGRVAPTSTSIQQ